MRRARADDREAVLAFASRTWDGWDYIPHAWPVWLEAADGILLVATPGGTAEGTAPADRDGQPITTDVPIAVARVALLSPTEAWLEGIRVDPRVRGMDVATDLQVAELRWAAEQGVSVVRYATGSRNEASHRLGARHGFRLLTALRTWWWSDPAAAEDAEDDDDENGFDAAARRQATARRQAGLGRLGEAGLVADPNAMADLWRRTAADTTFLAAERLYETRPWALAELTEEKFAGHLERGEVLFTDDAEAGWALAILEREAQPSEDLSFHFSLLIGEGAAALRLAEAARATIGDSVRFRLPDPDAPLLAGHTYDFAAAGYRAREWTLHILGRPLDAAHPPPAMDPAATIG